ncbi:MAG: ATP-binding protein [Pseudomonadota bacterium]
METEELAHEGIVFLDREAERQALLGALPPEATDPQLLIVLGPTGVGKSALTEHVTAQIADQVAIVLVDPYLRGEDRDPDRAYQGYFLQQCAAAISEVAAQRGNGFETFDLFVKGRGAKNLKGYDVEGTIQDLASPHKTVRRVFDVTKRAGGFGSYAAANLLKSDQRFAIEVCADYVRHAASAVPFVLVIQEAQHCDTRSFRFILQCLKEGGLFFPLLEYTTDDQTFQKRHQIQIDRFGAHRALHIDVLPWEYVTELLERRGRHGQEVIGEFRAKWDGNLRIFTGLEHRLAYGDGALATPPNLALPYDAVDAMRERLGALTRAERLVLALLKEHNEPIASEVLDAVWHSIDPARGLPLRLADAVAGLSQSYLSRSGSQIGLNNDDIATALARMEDAALFAGDAQQILLAFYRGAVDSAREGSIERAVAMRHATRLAAALPDVAALEGLLTALEGEVEAKGDASLYVDHVVSSLIEIDDLGDGERRALAEWAARHAYRSSNFGLAAAAIEQGRLESPLWTCILAHCLIEEFREPEAREIANQLRQELPYDDADLVSDLILGNLDLVAGNLDTCARRLDKTATDAERRGSILLGHAYRLLESAVPIEDAIAYCRKSARFYDEAGLAQSAAQSRITVSRHLARLGLVEEAQIALSDASASLRDVASSRQFYLNNLAATNLLSREPDFSAAEADLRSALLLSQDKFSDLTILQNLAIAIWQGRGAKAARGTVEQTLNILRDVDATTAHLADTVTYVAFAILNEAGEREAAQHALSHLRNAFGFDIETNDYWSWRFGLSAKRPDTYADEIMAKPYHPSFLSQWQLDWEVAHALFR